MSHFLIEAMQHLGIYYTPPRILTLGYGDGKTQGAIAGNPPFGATAREVDMSKFKTIQRVVEVFCPQCGGRGLVSTKHGSIKCTAPGCVDGYVKKLINEIVTDEEGKVTA